MADFLKLCREELTAAKAQRDELLAALRDAHLAACTWQSGCCFTNGVQKHTPACISRAALLKRFEGVGEVKPWAIT